MFIEKLDKSHLKVELTPLDMSGLEIEYSSFAYENEHSRTIIRSILKKAYEQTGFLYTNCKLLIEVFPARDSGCMILFTKMNPEKSVRLKLTSHKKGMIFSFKNAGDLLDCAAALDGVEIPAETKLYQYKGEYYLFIATRLGNIKKTYLILSEYGSNKCNQIESFFAEYGKLICKSDAISRLNRK